MTQSRVTKAQKQGKEPSDSLKELSEVSSDVETSELNKETSPLSKIHRGPSASRGEIKKRIIEAARSEFVTRGYDHTTMRSVARSAGCDPALITYYFNTKQKLFRACMDLPLDPASEIIALLMPGPKDAARRLVDYILDLYEHTDLRNAHRPHARSHHRHLNITAFSHLYAHGRP